MRYNIGLIFLLILSGCVQAPVAPNLKLPEFKPMNCPPVKQCPKLTMPPIAQDVEINIKGDTIVTLNPGGEEMLRYYVAAQESLRH